MILSAKSKSESLQMDLLCWIVQGTAGQTERLRPSFLQGIGSDEIMFATLDTVFVYLNENQIYYSSSNNA